MSYLPEDAYLYAVDDEDGEARERRLQQEEDDCETCAKYEGQMHPSHRGSTYCESGSIASGGSKAHCTCDWCF